MNLRMCVRREREPATHAENSCEKLEMQTGGGAKEGVAGVGQAATTWGRGAAGQRIFAILWNIIWPEGDTSDIGAKYPDQIQKIRSSHI